MSSPALADAYGNALSGCADVVRVHAWRCTPLVASAIMRAPATPLSAATAAAAAFGTRGHGGAHEDEELEALGAAEVCVVTIEPEDGLTGAVHASFVPRVAGTHAVRILVAGTEVAGSPFQATFVAGALCPAQCVARGEGLKRATAGVGSLIEVFAYDAAGNVVGEGDGSRFEVGLRSASGTALDCTSRCFDRGDGSYRVAYSTVVAGVGHQLSVTCRGVAIRGSPFTVGVAPGRAHPPYCFVVGPGATYAPLGPRLGKFTVQCVDRWRNACVRGGERLCVRAAGPTHPLVSILDADDGAYEVTTRYGLSGVYQLAVALWLPGERRAPVAGSPFTVHVGLQLAEAYLVRWLADMPRSLPALAVDATGGRAWSGGSSSVLAVARLGTWRHDAQALAAQALRGWKLFVGRAILERMVKGVVPVGSPRAVRQVRAHPRAGAVQSAVALRDRATANGALLQSPRSRR